MILERAVSSLKQSLAHLSTYLDEEPDTLGVALRRRKVPLELVERSEDILVALRTDIESDKTDDVGGVKLNFYFLVEACNAVITVRRCSITRQ